MNTNIQVEDISFDFKINKLFNLGLFINVTSCFKKMSDIFRYLNCHFNIKQVLQIEK